MRTNVTGLTLTSPGQGRQPSISMRIAFDLDDIHAERLRGLAAETRSCSKYPPAFGINVLVDDSEGVVREANRFGFDVIQVRPDDVAWSTTVKHAVELLGQERAA